MLFIIGLGNPGDEYIETRHNVGFAIVDTLAKLTETRLDEHRGECIIGWARYHQTTFGLVKPQTYMNNSGIAVKDVLETYNSSPHELLVITDDFHLPLGALRLRLRGSDGGHNGLYSIIYHLQTEDFPRMRCGISGASVPAAKSTMADYVLAPFEQNEQEIVRRMILQARDAALATTEHGIQFAMNRYNTKELN